VFESPGRFPSHLEPALSPTGLEDPYLEHTGHSLQPRQPTIYLEPAPSTTSVYGAVTTYSYTSYGALVQSTTNGRWEQHYLDGFGRTITFNRGYGSTFVSTIKHSVRPMHLLAAGEDDTGIGAVRCGRRAELHGVHPTTALGGR